MQTTSMTHRSIVSLAKTAIVAAIYVVMTLMLSPLSFGIVQVRFSEMLNYTALFNRRYVWAVTLGVFLANLASPTAILDVPIGTIGTLAFILLSRCPLNVYRCRRAGRAQQGTILANIRHHCARRSAFDGSRRRCDDGADAVCGFG